MKQLTCEMCGSTNLLKQDGVFVCQTCGTKYSVEEAKKMMADGTFEAPSSAKANVSEKVNNLFITARRAKNDNNAELAAKYYEMITLEDPYNWEAFFYSNYYTAKKTNLRDMAYSVTRLSNSLDSVFDLVDKAGKYADEKWRITEEIMRSIDDLCESFASWAKSHYRSYSNLERTVSELHDRAYAVADLQKHMADLLEKYFADRSKMARAYYLKSYVKNYLLLDTVDRMFVNITLQYHSKKLIEAENRIKELDPEYKPLITPAAKSNANAKDAAPMPKSAKVCFNLCWILPLLALILMYPMATNHGDSGLLISLALLVGGPIIFAVIGRILYESNKGKK